MRTRILLAVAVFGAVAAMAAWGGAGASAAPVQKEPATPVSQTQAALDTVVSVKPPVAPMKIPATPTAVPAKAPLVQMAILLDTSGSMSGLIDQARTQLWGIVNALAGARRGEVAPRLQIALYAYGEAGHPNEIHRRTAFTEDLDLVSRELFALRTTGGFEPAGTVIDLATRELEWSSDADALKIIYIAGNEEFTQGNVDPYKAAADAAKRGIVVNAINCGDSGEIAAGWRRGAGAGGGKYFAINHNQRVIDVAAPQDAELAALNQKLNGTYVPYGAHGEEGQRNQVAQDSNAAGLSTSTLAARAASKSSGLYRASTWDLVDAVRDGTVDVSKAKDAELPQDLRGKDAEERKAWVQAKREEREQIQRRIADLSAERQRFVEDARRKAGGGESLDSAIIGSVKDLGVKARLSFK